MTIELQFLGAARHVTGTKHLLKVGSRQVLLDCGMVQGPRKVADDANRRLPEHLTRIDALVLSHAHIDHSGALPRLVKLGYGGPIHCTDATADMVRMMLLDAAHIQTQDARHLRKRGIEVEPLYDIDDVETTLKLLRPVPYGKEFEVVPGVRCHFLDAGHILGAAIVVLDVDEQGRKRRIVFTGDHGRKNLPILRDPERIPECDALITESTYGDREHEKLKDLPEILARIVDQEMQDGGRIIVPAFAVGRTQNLVYELGQLMAGGRIPQQQIYVDSPMSTQATKIMAGHPDLFDKQTQALLKRGEHPFFFDGVRYVADVEESKSLNAVRSGIIISASGMCESGRVLHHIKQSVGRHQDCILLVGFQAHGTLGRRLQDGQPRVNILGDEYEVNCKIQFLPGLSAHADRVELLGACRHLAGRCRQVFVVHGEEEAAFAYAGELRDNGFTGIEVPEKGQTFEVR